MGAEKSVPDFIILLEVPFKLMMCTINHFFIIIAFKVNLNVINV